MTGSTPVLSVAVAVQHAQANLDEVLAALRPADHPDVEFLFCHTPADPETERLAAGPANLRVLPAAAGALIPHLWRDAIRSARGARVATTTAACIPAADWLERLLETDLAGRAGIGGRIVCDPGADPVGRAVHILRYNAHGSELPSDDVGEIAADNAVYVRGEILAEDDLLRDGFWEPAFHARFRRRGLGLRYDPKLLVIHRNRYTAGQFFAQRLAHGRAFARDRLRGRSAAYQGLLIAASPALPFLFLIRVLRRSLGQAELRQHLVRALPWLLLFVLGWGLGELGGYMRGRSG